MRRAFLLLCFFPVILNAYSQEPSNAESKNALVSELQSWDEARIKTYLLGQRRRSNGTIVSAVGAGLLSVGTAIGLGAPVVVMGGVFALVGGVQAVSGSVKVLEAIDNTQPREGQSLPQVSEPESNAAKSWKPEIGSIVFFQLDGTVTQGRVLKANMDETQYRVQYDLSGKEKSKWMYRYALFDKPTSVEK